MALAPFQIVVTSFEIDKGTVTPTLSHIFYGQTLEKAYQVARSHLISDYFFSEAMLGQLHWKNSIITISNTGDIISQQPIPQLEKDALFKRLYQEAIQITQKKQQLGVMLMMQRLTSM